MILLTFQVQKVVFFQEGWMSKSPGGDDVSSEFVANIGGPKTVSDTEFELNGNLSGLYSTHPTQAYLVSGFPYLAVAAFTHLGTASSANAVCLAFQAS